VNIRNSLVIESDVRLEIQSPGLGFGFS
jgi:hypothetical protein